MAEKYDFKFYELEKNAANKPFLKQPFGDKWETWTWGEVGQMARKLATALQSMGFPPKSHIGLVSKNCREWIVADLAIMMAGFVSVPLYATLTGKQTAEVLELGDVKAIFVGKLDVWEDMKTGIPEDMPVIAFPHYSGMNKVERGIQWKDLLAKHKPLQGNPCPNLEDLWTIVFTSGTTGTPKGVMLTYRINQCTDMVVQTTNPLHLSKEGDNRFFSFLPLNHIAERVIVEATCLHHGGTISFAESLKTFSKNLQDTQPTVFFAVPRIWTKFQQGILAKMPQKKLNLFLKIPFLSSYIKKKIRTGLGLNGARAWASGAAPMSETQKNWYRKIGIDITDGYGMTENCALTTTIPGKDKTKGSVGKAHYGVELKIDEATGEILMRGDYVMKGYYKNPEKTVEALKDGWLHTGDQGRLDKNGYLYITGRIKDTFKTSKGKFIVPAPMEFPLSNDPNIEQVCVVGLGCPQPLALVVLSDMGNALSKEDAIQALTECLINANAKAIATKAGHKVISTIVVNKEAWSVENGLLTPTLKVKRNQINQKYQAYLEAWHEQKEKIIFEK